METKIIAPLSTLEEVSQLAEAGADEIYCGVQPEAWARDYGFSDTLTRRQGIVANFASLEELLTVPEAAKGSGLRCALTLNVRYTRDQLPLVLEVAEQWCEAGGDALIVSDLELLLALKRREISIQRHLSVLAPVFNSGAASFFRSLGVSRIILPRSLAVDEISALTRRHPGFGFSAIILNEKCPYIDGFCRFYHGTSFPPHTRTYFSYGKAQEKNTPHTYSPDPAYAGHGCRIAFQRENGTFVEPQHQDDVNSPSCGICMIPGLSGAGINYLKMAGRGLPPFLKVRAVKFIRTAVNTIAGNTPPRLDVAEALQKLYAKTFGSECSSASCYYTDPAELERR